VGDYTYVDLGSSDGNANYTPTGGTIASSVPYHAMQDYDNLDDRDTIGTWRLEIDAASITGVIVSWQITIRYEAI
jgi:hypothetical protein